MKTIDIIGVSRLRMGTDGEGIRTLVAAQGCPLRCKYCLNPHSWNGEGKMQTLTIAELYELLKVDNLYFLSSDGGVTFGGGEPLLYASFIKEFVDYTEHRWNIMVETSLNVPAENLETVIDRVDKYIVDIKSADDAIYQVYTGGDNKQVLDNLRFLISRVGAEQVQVRVPRIPGYTTEESVEETVRQLQELGVGGIEVFPYFVI